MAEYIEIEPLGDYGYLVRIREGAEEAEVRFQASTAVLDELNITGADEAQIVKETAAYLTRHQPVMVRFSARSCVKSTSSFGSYASGWIPSSCVEYSPNRLRLWRIDPRAHYGALDGLARHRINTRIISEHWDEICRLTASRRAGTVIPSAILRTLQRGPNPSSLARALTELGRVIKTLHALEYCHDPAYRRTIHHLLSRGERRNSLARDVFHGQRGHLRKHYQVGQENQLDSLGIMVNLIVCWQTRYMQAALDHLAANGYPIDPADVARLTPLGHPPSTSMAATGPPAAHPPPDSDHSGPSPDSGSCTNPRHRPVW